MNTLEKSERMVASIVAFLAERGVERTDFSVAEIGFELTRENDQLFSDAMIWLSAEGIIRSNDRIDYVAGKDNETVAISFSLTSFGFKLLSETYEGELTLGQAVSKTNSSGVGYANVGNLLGGLLGSFTKSVSG
ncbi:hypothetical protein AB9K34_06000 [Sedimentitalea sp. XS_ASV28]|uniref:hypothetical protein n=1 Tax=Sedimentitalea sp. XS_ASV28 TaxID=3241296 RepID=UPI003515B7F6